MQTSFTMRKLRPRGVARLLVLSIVIGALTCIPMGTLASPETVSGAGINGGGSCFQTAPSLGTIVSNVLVCWNAFTGEFEVYFTAKGGIAGTGVCGNSGVTPPPSPWPGATLVYRPQGLNWEIHIVPETNPLPSSITLTYTVRGYTKTTPLTPYEFLYTVGFDPALVMAQPSHCMQLFP